MLSTAIESNADVCHWEARSRRMYCGNRGGTDSGMYIDASEESSCIVLAVLTARSDCIAYRKPPCDLSALDLDLPVCLDIVNPLTRSTLWQPAYDAQAAAWVRGYSA